MAHASEQLLRRLEWQVVRRLDGQLQGSYRTHFYGSGIDFADLRTYTPEDDVRHIDWNVTARLDEPHVRQYTEDRELTAWLLLDRSRSMEFGPRDRGKDVVLTELAITLARLLARGGNRVGALLYDERLERVVPPRTGRTHVLRLSHELAKPRPGAAGSGDDDRPGARCCASRCRPSAAVRWCSSSPTSSPGPAGSGRCPVSCNATRWSWCGWSIRSSGSCRRSG